MSFQSKITAQALMGSNETPNDTFADVLRRRLSRRAVLKKALAGAPALVLGASFLNSQSAKGQPGANTCDVRDADACALGFESIGLQTADDVIVPPGYAADVVIRWGDPILPGAPGFDLNRQTAAAQSLQFGFNCDFVGYYPLLNFRSGNPNNGLLAINHEYTTPQEMFPGYVVGSPTKEQVDTELAAHGVSVVEVRRDAGRRWRAHPGSVFNRRITGETPIQITGPAAGHDWMKTSYDPSGTWVRGTLNNCAGGKTPWGTLLTCEENFNQYFAHRDLVADFAKKANHSRYGLPRAASERKWEAHHSRFDLALEPNEPFRFGWVIEIDPYNPNSTPAKRTALGRFKHEGATTALAADGRVVVYSGDDERFDYIYKFVSRGRYNPHVREANLGLLDDGILYVARLNDDGTGEWLPLVHGLGPLVAPAFPSQADVLINTRGAADALGGTRMDRPEDIEVNPANGRVYCIMTNNTQRGVTGSDGAPVNPRDPGLDAANPRANNRHGHLIEFIEAGDDPAAATFQWEIFILCGDPANPEDGTYFAGCDPALVSPISAPDNLVFDCGGNIWIATDGQARNLPGNDGLFAAPVEGAERGCLRQFMSCPVGGEVCGPEFTPDYQTLFLAIQHPGEEVPGSSTWPDGGVPKPSVIAIVKEAPGRPTIGS